MGDRGRESIGDWGGGDIIAPYSLKLAAMLGLPQIRQALPAILFMSMEISSRHTPMMPLIFIGKAFKFSCRGVLSGERENIWRWHILGHLFSILRPLRLWLVQPWSQVMDNVDNAAQVLSSLSVV